MDIISARLSPGMFEVDPNIAVERCHDMTCHRQQKTADEDVEQNLGIIKHLGQEDQVHRIVEKFVGPDMADERCKEIRPRITRGKI